MKSNKSITIIFITAVVVISASVLVYNLMNPRNPRLQKAIVPTVVKTDIKPKIVQPVEPTIELPKFVKPRAHTTKALSKQGNVGTNPAIVPAGGIEIMAGLTNRIMSAV